MSYHLIHRRAPMTQPSQPAAVPSRSLARQIAEAQHNGIVAAARIQSAAFATGVGMRSALMLSRDADEAFRASPMGEHHYRDLLNAFGGVARFEIERLAFHGEGCS